MKEIAIALTATALSATGAEAAEVRRDRVAPPAVYDVAPGLGRFTDDVLFGEVWRRADLAPRDRSLVTVAALVATGRTAQLGGHVARALDNGVKPDEIGELITHLAFYTGWPNAISAVAEVRKVFDARGIAAVEAYDGAPLDLDARAEAARAAAVKTTVAPTAPTLADLTDRVLFGDLWRRPCLAPRDRSLITIAALIAIGQPEQLPFHLNRAMDAGLTRAEASEAVTHLGFYAGWPRAMSAVAVLERVFAARTAAATSPASGGELRIVRAAPDEATRGPAAFFTGEVEISGLYQGDAPTRIGGGTVAFSAGARTVWHTHPLGQTLFVVSGRGLIQNEGGPIEEIFPGDVVWIPPETRHWHGAAIDSPMTHFAVAEALDGKAVTWMEPVPDAVYRAGPPKR